MNIFFTERGSCRAAHASGLYGYPYEVFDPIRSLYLHRGANSLTEDTSLMAD